MNTDFISFNFDEESEPVEKTSESQTESTESEAPQLPPPRPPPVGIEQVKPVEIVIPDPPSTPHTPSAKLQRRFSMSTTKNNFTSFAETTSQIPPPANRPEIVVPAAFREVSDEGAPIHNPKHLRMAAIMKSLSINSSTNLTLFEKEEMECRMQRCLDLASAAVHSKFVPEGSDIFSLLWLRVLTFTFRRRFPIYSGYGLVSTTHTRKGIHNKEHSAVHEGIISCTYSLKMSILLFIVCQNIGTGLAEGYFHQIKDAHQLVLQSQLTRLERFQVNDIILLQAKVMVYFFFAESISQSTFSWK